MNCLLQVSIGEIPGKLQLQSWAPSSLRLWNKNWATIRRMVVGQAKNPYSHSKVEEQTGKGMVLGKPKSNTILRLKAGQLSLLTLCPMLWQHWSGRTGPQGLRPLCCYGSVHTLILIGRHLGPVPVPGSHHTLGFTVQRCGKKDVFSGKLTPIAPLYIVLVEIFWWLLEYVSTWPRATQ